MDHTLNTISIYNKRVKEYVERFMDLNLYKGSFDIFSEFIPWNASVIELGCGPGNVVKYLRSKRPDLDIWGIDFATEMIKEAEKQNPGGKFSVMDIRNADKIQQEFDAVIAAFSLPYIDRQDAPALFNTFNKLTTKNGYLYLSCMEGPAARSGFEKTSFGEEIFINYYERSEIESWLKENNFTVKKFFTQDYHERDGTITIDLFFIAQKN